MATDPTQRIREHLYETSIALDAHQTLVELAALPPSLDVPYVTVSLDWRFKGSDPGREPVSSPRPSERGTPRVAGESHRPSRQAFDRAIASLIEEVGPRGAAFDSISADAARISAYLDSELDPSAKGVFIVSCSASDVFEALALGLPVPTQVSAGPTAALFNLARLVDDHPTYAVLVADQHEATLSFITQARRGSSVSLDSSTYPRKQQQGGWSQRRFQARADERVAAFARDIAREIRSDLDEAGVELLVLAGDEVITSALDEAFHDTVTARIIARLRLDIGASEQEIIAATLPVVEQVERDREAEAVSSLGDAIGADERGLAGVDETLEALQSGQVAMLLITDDFAAPGWADYALGYVRAGESPAAHPLGGDLANITPVNVADELVRLALVGGAEVQIVHGDVPFGVTDEEVVPEAGRDQPRTEAAAALDAVGGVGALLRFSIDEDRQAR